MRLAREVLILQNTEATTNLMLVPIDHLDNSFSGLFFPLFALIIKDPVANFNLLKYRLRSINIIFQVLNHSNLTVLLLDFLA